MKIYKLIILVIVLSSCSGKKNSHPDQHEKTTAGNQIIRPDFQSIIDSLNVVGAVLVYDFQKDIYYANDFKWADKGNLPASTFKIVNSIIALESGVVENDSTFFKWKGKKEP